VFLVERQGRSLRLERFDLRDPRFHVAVIVTTVNVLGQTVLGFDVSVAQQLIAFGTAVGLGFAEQILRDRVIAWPASAGLIGNGIAFVLRVPGTRHGEWWSTRGWWIFAGASALAIASRHLLRSHGRHWFNPSNFALVVVFLVLGSARVEPQLLWFGPLGVGLVATYATIIVGGASLMIRLRAVRLPLSFLATYAPGMVILGGLGQCMRTSWTLRPVCGAGFTTTLLTSPEVLIFLFLMITDPRTSPAAGAVRRSAYGASVGVLATVLMAPQQTEFAIKVALLGALTITCALRVLFESRLPEAGSDTDNIRAAIRSYVA